MGEGVGRRRAYNVIGAVANGARDSQRDAILNELHDERLLRRRHPAAKDGGGNQTELEQVLLVSLEQICQTSAVHNQPVVDRVRRWRLLREFQANPRSEPCAIADG